MGGQVRATLNNDSEVTVIIDSDLGEPRSSGAAGIEGVVSDRIRLHAAVEGFPPSLLMGGAITLDSEVQPWNVDRIAEDLGMYEIDLSRPRA